MNEGLESLGENQWRPGFVFCATQLRRVVLPATLRVMRQRTFTECARLRSVAFKSGTCLDYID